MSKSAKIIIALGLIAFAAACAKKEEVVYVDPQPISIEPVHMGKYK